MTDDLRGPMTQVLRDLGRVMGGVENITAEMQQMRVISAQQNERMQENNQRAMNTAQKAVQQGESIKRDTTQIQAKVEAVIQDVKDLDMRVEASVVRIAALELPHQEAARNKDARGKLFVRAITIISSLVFILAAALKPVWELFVSEVWKKWTH